MLGIQIRKWSPRIEDESLMASGNYLQLKLW